jgi:vancomycin resistance protein VanW
MKYKKLRLAIDDFKCLLRGYYFGISTKKNAQMNTDEWHQLSHARLKINWRPELGEVNLNRIHNISLGSELLNNVYLKKGEVLSLRYFLEDTSEKLGFKSGPMFVDGKISYVDGGGLCLVSTVLFDAALKANLEIIEKHNHSTDLWGDDRFIDLGRDATYVHGLKDLKIRNNSTSPVIFKFVTDKEKLTLDCRVYSEKPLNGKVEIEKNILGEILPANLSTNDKPDINFRKGWEVETSRYFISENNKTISYRKKEIYKPFVLNSP